MVHFYQTTKLYISEDCDINGLWYENLTSQLVISSASRLNYLEGRIQLSFVTV